MLDRLRIATRKSPLALWQAEHVKAALQAANSGLEVELVTMTTQGDKLLDSPLAKIGGKGLFVKELEQGILDGSADIAVHSMKDVPVHLPDGLHLPVIMRRENPFDALVSNRYRSFDDMPSNARIGTCSLRRQSQILARYPDFEICVLRGNVNSRLAKLDNGDFDAIVLAAAGLIRLGMADRIAHEISADVSLPAVGQGALGIECRVGDKDVMQLIETLHDDKTASRLAAERALNARLNGGCQVPIAAYAEIDGETLDLRGMVASPDGKRILYSDVRGDVADAHSIGIRAAESLLEQGAHELLSSLGIDV
ncbi:MAG: hydroxymethylbilane synthase [Pseudomonadota bacterium]